MEKLAELRRKLGVAVDELNSDAVLADAALYATKKAEVENMHSLIVRAEEARAQSAALARPLGEPDPDAEPVWTPPARNLGVDRTLSIGGDARAFVGPASQQFSRYLSRARAELAGGGFQLTPEKHFRSLGEQLQAVQQFAMTRGSQQDGRLVRAPTGAGEIDPTGGGFLVQTDFSTAIWMLAHDMGEVLGRVNKIPISANSNGLKIPGVDETSRATGSRWGGVQSYWVDEGTAPTASKPKFRTIDSTCKKLFSIMYTTDELLQDSTALTAIAGQAFSEEIMFMTEDAIFEGTGAGMPFGVHLIRPSLFRSPSRPARPRRRSSGKTSTACGRAAGSARGKTPCGSSTRTASRSSTSSTRRSALGGQPQSIRRPAACPARRMRPSTGARWS